MLAQPSNVDESLQAHEVPLHLPSAACTQASVSSVLLTHEFRLRQAQAYDALADLRGHLEVRAYVFRYKDQHVRGQREHGRSIDIIKGIEGKIKMDAHRYRTAYAALMTLATALGKTDWRATLQPLNETDIRHIAVTDGSGSEGRRQISWIWQAGSEDGTVSDAAVQSNLQECKCAHFVVRVCTDSLY